MVAAFVPVAVGLGLTAPQLVSRLYPRTAHALVSAAVPSVLPTDARPFDPDGASAAGPDLVVERVGPQRTRIALTACGDTRETGDRPVRCGSLTVERPVEQVGFLRLPGGRVVVVQRLAWAVPASKYDQLPRLAAFDVVDEDGRVFAPRRLFSRPLLPSVVLWLAAIALGVAAIATRRARDYVSRFSTWREGSVDREGLVRVGHDILRFMSRGVSPGPVLVDPDALPSGAYRDALRIRRGDVVPGTHDAWRRGTARRLRDARTLAIVAIASTLLALAARLIGG